jgi:hypothetical protein
LKYLGLATLWDVVAMRLFGHLLFRREWF